MKITTIIAAVLFLAAACTQKTETSSTVGDNTTVQSTTVSVPAVDTAATAEMKKDVKAGAEAAAQGVKDAAHATSTAVKEGAKTVSQGAKDAAHATGTAMEKAGKEIQKRTEPKKKP